MKQIVDAKATMLGRADELIGRLKSKPEVLGVMVHGGISNNTRHATDWCSDLDISIVTTPGYISWHNFKHYEWLKDRWLEVDMYHFSFDDDSMWSTATREGYAYSTNIVFDRTGGKISSWLEEHTKLDGKYREESIRNKLLEALDIFYNIEKEKDFVDSNIKLFKVISLLCETVFFINWEYPPDVKWRVSGASHLTWKPSNFVDLLGRCYQTLDLTAKRTAIAEFIDTIMWKISEEKICALPNFGSCTNKDDVIQIARLFTRLDKYSGHSIKKCVKRGLPWNAHDLVNEGIENAIDIVYHINNSKMPSTNKFTGLASLSWKPVNYEVLIRESTVIRDYSDPNDTLRRMNALRELFLEIKSKIGEMRLFAVSSLYDNNFMDENLFGKDSPYRMIYKQGGYVNRSQLEETFAENLIEKMSGFSQREKNILFGMCNHYLIGSKEELCLLNRAKMCEPYVPVWEKVVKKL